MVDELNDMEVLPDPDPATECPDWGSTGDPRGCMSTNVAGGAVDSRQ